VVRFSLTVGAVVLLVVGGAGSAGAQTDYDSTKDRMLVGTVQVPGGAPEGRAIVTLYNSLHTLIERSATNDSGSFSFTGVGAGDLLVVVELAGYQTATIGVQVFPNAKLTMVPPIVLRREPSQQVATEGSVEAVELTLNKEASKEYDRGVQALSKGQAAEARSRLEHVVKLEPRFAGGAYALGAAQSALGDYAGAEASFRRAIELEPKRADYYFALGKVLNLAQHPDQALPAVEKGLSLAPHSSLGLYAESQCQLLLGHYDAAIETAHKALAESPPPSPEIHLAIAQGYIKLGRYPDAVEELATYLELEPHSANASRAKEVMEKLKATSKVAQKAVPN
jgi:predicted Zn-dependent protease